MKSVSAAVELTQSLTVTVPVTSRSAEGAHSGRPPRRDARRAEAIGGRVGVVAGSLVVAAAVIKPWFDEILPPIVGTGCWGSNV